MVTDTIPIAPDISYIPSSEEPLSANVVLMEGAQYLWLYDVGSAPEVAEIIRRSGKRVCAVLSHFHPDHTGNLSRLDCEEIYQCRNTFGYTHRGVVIGEDTFLEDGALRLHLFPVPSCHAKGSLALEVNETWCFLGDAAYATRKNGQAVYNTGLLIELIRRLEQVRATYLLMSHHDPFVQKREEVLDWLNEIAALRRPGEAFIPV